MRALALGISALPAVAISGAFRLAQQLRRVRLQIEAEVVARSEIREPAIANPDHPPVDLVDNCVSHRV